jgi:hypothetical protein
MNSLCLLVGPQCSCWAQPEGLPSSAAQCEPAVPRKRRDRQFETGGSSAAPKGSNQTDLRPTLADLFYGSDLPKRPSATSIRLVCIQSVNGLCTRRGPTRQVRS